jgi:mannose-1-phosphate guanylyltransferase
LGTAGGLYHFRDQILAGQPDYFFLMNSDVCGDFPLKEMLCEHRNRGKGIYCTILGTEVHILIVNTISKEMIWM